LEENNSQNLENIQLYTSGFGRILFCETLEAIILINNISDKEIRIKDIKFKVSNEILEDYEAMFKKFEFFLINMSGPFVIPPGYFMHKKIKILADTLCKYVLEIQIEYCSIYYNDEFVKHNTNKVIKTISNHYYITSNPSNVVAKFFKKFLFSTNLPFKIKDKIVTNNLEKTYVEIILINSTNYILEVKDVNFLMDNINVSSISGSGDLDLLNDCNNNNNNTEEFVKNENDFINSSNNNNNKSNNKENSLLIEPEEEINFAFSITNYKAFINSVIFFILIFQSAFLFRVSWTKRDENEIKYLNFSLKNKAVNDLFNIILIQKPNDEIIKDEYFNIILQFVNKTQSKKKIFNKKNTKKI